MSTKFFTLSTAEPYDDNETVALVAFTTISSAAAAGGGSKGRRMRPKVRRAIAFQLPPVGVFTELR